MAKTLILFLAFILLSCGENSGNNNKEPEERKTEDAPKHQNKTGGRTSGDAPEIAVIEAAGNMDWIFGKDYNKWTPSQSDIENALSRIDDCFKDQERGTVNRLLNRNPEEYCMQFVGAINSQGEKILWVNCFCKSQVEFMKDWKQSIIGVADGGNCFFNVRFNLDRDEPYYLRVNGYA